MVECQPEEHFPERGPERSDGEKLAQVTRAMVHLMKEFFGKGPTKARTSWAGDDALICIMGGGFTPVEQTLYEAGRGEAVHQMRHAVQTAMEERLRLEVEDIIGRRVVAFMSASHQHPDVACDVFLLEPKLGDVDSPLRAANQESPSEL